MKYLLSINRHFLGHYVCVRTLSNSFSHFLTELIKITSSLMTPHTHLQYIKYLTVYVGPPFSIKLQLVYYTVMMFYNTI